MSLTLEHPPSRHRTASPHTPSTLPGRPLFPTPSPRPSTASTQSSFSTARTTLDPPRFHHYLPYTSTSNEAVYTQTATNFPPTTPFVSLPPVRFGRFYQYMPALSGAEDDVYTDGVNVMYDTLRGPGQLHVLPEQKVVGKFRAVRDGVVSVGAEYATYRPGGGVADAVGVDVSAASAHGERKGAKLRKEKHRRSVSLAEMSEKVRDMLRKLHFGKKTE